MVESLTVGDAKGTMGLFDKACDEFVGQCTLTSGMSIAENSHVTTDDPRRP